MIPGGMTTATAVAAGMQGNTLFVFAKGAAGQLHFTLAPEGGAFVDWQPVPRGLVTTAAPASAGRTDNLFVSLCRATAPSSSTRSVRVARLSAGKRFLVVSSPMPQLAPECRERSCSSSPKTRVAGL